MWSYQTTEDEEEEEEDDDAHSWASWTGGALLSVFSIRPLEDRHSISIWRTDVCINV